MCVLFGRVCWICFDFSTTKSHTLLKSGAPGKKEWTIPQKFQTLLQFANTLCACYFGFDRNRDKRETLWDILLIIIFFNTPSVSIQCVILSLPIWDWTDMLHVSQVSQNVTVVAALTLGMNLQWIALWMSKKSTSLLLVVFLTWCASFVLGLLLFEWQQLKQLSSLLMILNMKFGSSGACWLRTRETLQRKSDNQHSTS